MLFFFQAKCCGYGTNGQMTIGYDCVIIPISTLKNTLGALIPGSSDEFCGRALASQSTQGPATICCKKFQDLGPNRLHTSLKAVVTDPIPI